MTGWLEQAGLSIDFIANEIFVSGGAFRWPQKLNGQITKNRYFFILNISPQIDELVILVTPTTQIEKTVKHNFYGDLVRITKNDYESLERDSIVDCSSPLKYPREQILKAISKTEIELLPPIPVKLLNQLRETLMQSIKVSDDIKGFVFEDENGCDFKSTALD